MQITITPDPVDFGDVDPGSRSSMTAKVEFSEPLEAAASVSVASPFQPDRTSIAAGSTSAAVVISLAAPSAPGPCQGQLKVSDPKNRQEASAKVSAMVLQKKSRATKVETHLLFKVPDYGDTTYVNPPGRGVDGKALTSFLRLGAFDYDSEPRGAQELLRIIPKVTSAVSPTTDAATTKILDDLDEGTIFADDIRLRPQDCDPAMPKADDPDHKLTKTQRQDESELLYARGGWRDHSDGNRISTTYGDKVEVVRGNYKMIVMGRQNETDRAMGWDVGGGHIQDFAPGTMPGASFYLEWINDTNYHAPASAGGQKGVWLLVNTTENVYEYARNAGNFREEVWGDVNEAYVGSENPPTGTSWATDDSTGIDGHEPPVRLSDRNYDYPGTAANRATPPWAEDNAGMLRSNPHIIEKTWAERIDSYTGTEACRVPHIHEEKWAEEVYEVTNISGSVFGETKITEGVVETTAIDGGVLATTSIGGAQFEVTSIGGAAIGLTNVGGIIFEETASLVQVEIGGAALHVAFELSVVLDIYVGAKFEFGFGYSLGLQNFKDEMAILENDIKGNKSDIFTNKNNVLCNKLNMMANKTDIDGVKSKIAATDTEVSTVKSIN